MTARRNLPMGLFAAVDLGSRSFHLTVARVHGENTEVVDRVKEAVRLAAGIRDKAIEPATWERAEAALARIGERIRDIPAGQARAVGTNAFRQVKNRKALLGRAAKALGHRVEVISGAEEARLIYLGVSHLLPEENGRRLVVDIGGGSTELVIGQSHEPLRAASLYMGCVSYTRRFFPGGVITKQAFVAAETEVRRELETVEEGFLGLGWSSVFGSSGTVLAAAELLRANGGLTRPGLKSLRGRMIRAAHVEALAEGPDAISGFPADRVWDFPGGVAILRAAMKSLDIQRIEPADGALREGVLFDLIGRRRREDVREATIRNLVSQYRVDREQAERVKATALVGLRQLRASWGLEHESHERFLRWAADLHEVGLSVSFSGYHRHGAYIVRNSDMPGFSRDDQELLAALIETHRQKLRYGRFDEMTAADAVTTGRLAAILRIAVLLCRRRSREPLPLIEANAVDGRLGLSFPPGWLDHHPLTRAGIAQEATELAAIGLELRVRDAALSTAEGG
ncbi:MAG: Ppx/GppA family phosphatase [Acidobacteria bacterium]|nr:Ppx/GppA family phosphatase [Acidobacteriota bacterium]